jgi:LCP family protein required for cell wall assembly
MSLEQPLPSRAARKASTRPPKKPRRKKRLSIGKILFVLVTVIILCLTGYVLYLYDKLDDNLGRIASPVSAEVPKEQLAKAKPIGIVLLGLDYRQVTGSMNTDVMMAAVLNPVSKTATVVSIPRDSDLDLDNYVTRKANGYYARFLSIARNTHKLTGDDATRYAGDEMKKMLSEFFEVPMDYIAVLDFQGFVDFIDALGGVKVYVDQDMRYWDNADGTNIDLKKGEQVLNGEDALGFVRYRQSRNGETRPSSDFERNDRQDRLLGAIISELKSFESVTRIGSLMDAVGKNLKTDIPREQINSLITTYFGIPRENVRFIALTGEWRSPYVHLDQDKLSEAKQALKEELNPDGRVISAKEPETESEVTEGAKAAQEQ